MITVPSPIRGARSEQLIDHSKAATSRRHGVLLLSRDLLIIFVVAMLASFLIKTFLVRSFFIPSASMQGTLEVEDRIIVNELVPDLIPVERGDVVVFQYPGGWLPTIPMIESPPLVAAVDWFLAFVGRSASEAFRCRWRDDKCASVDLGVASMGVLEYSIMINAAPELVWRAYADPSRMPDWQTGKPVIHRRPRRARRPRLEIRVKARPACCAYHGVDRRGAARDGDQDGRLPRPGD